MNVQSFLIKLNSKYEVSIQENEGYVRIENKNNGNYLNIYEDIIEYEESNKFEYEYTVQFSTQHRHFNDLKTALDYIVEIVEDNILAIEFFDRKGNDRFGGDIDKQTAAHLTKSTLAKDWGYTCAYIRKFLFEIHSWSGRYDVNRMPVSMLPN